METPTLHDATVELSEGVALLTFRRNDVRNALTGTALVDDILATLDWAETTPAVSVLVMTGEGAAFSSGGNVKEMQERRGIFGGTALQIQDQYRRGIQRLPLAMERAEIPIIAAINGPAIGAGFDLACMCDLRLASAKAVLGETFVNLGIIPGDGGAWFLQRLVGYQKAAELTLTGRLVPAAEALQLGLVLELAEPDQLLERTVALARQLAGKPPQALRLAKRVLKLAQRGTLSDFLETCASLQAMAHHTSDHQEAVAAFLEKREPVFTGS